MKQLMAVVLYLAASNALSDDGHVQIQVIPHYANWHNKQAIIRDATVHPVQGPYDSLDPKAIEYDNAQLRENHMVPAISWWGPKGSPLAYSGDIFLDTYLSVPSPVQCILLYEVTERLTKGADGTYSFDDPANAAQFTADVQHLMNDYMLRPEYRDRFFTIDGKPVLFIWLSHAFSGRFDLASQQIPNRDKLFILGSNFTVGGSTPAPGDTSIIGGLDGISAYGIYDQALTRQQSTDGIVGHQNEAYLNVYREGIGRWSLWLSRWAPTVGLFPPMEFAYHDTHGNFPMTSTQAEADTFAAAVQQIIINSVACHRNIRPYIFQVSFNEWYEGSSVQPSTEYGTGFIDILRKYFKDPVPLAGATCSN